MGIDEKINAGLRNRGARGPGAGIETLPPAATTLTHRAASVKVGTPAVRLGSDVPATHATSKLLLPSKASLHGSSARNASSDRRPARPCIGNLDLARLDLSARSFMSIVCTVTHTDEFRCVQAGSLKHVISLRSLAATPPRTPSFSSSISVLTPSRSHRACSRVRPLSRARLLFFSLCHWAASNIQPSARTFAHASSLALLPARPTTLLALHSPPRKAVPSSMSAMQIDSKRLQRMQTTPHDITRLRNDPARYRTTALRLRSTLFVHLR